MLCRPRVPHDSFNPSESSIGSSGNPDRPPVSSWTGEVYPDGAWKNSSRIYIDGNRAMGGIDRDTELE
jgi:hypothetical protein